MTGPRITDRPGTPAAWTPPPDWTADALCTQADPDAWFPEQGRSPRAAQAICADCTVREQCLQYALDHDEHFGIWGGLSEAQRRRIRPRPTIPDSRTCPTCERTFAPAVHNQTWCSKDCWQRPEQRKRAAA